MIPGALSVSPFTGDLSRALSDLRNDQVNPHLRKRPGDCSTDPRQFHPAIPWSSEYSSLCPLAVASYEGAMLRVMRVLRASSK